MKINIFQYRTGEYGVSAITHMNKDEEIIALKQGLAANSIDFHKTDTKDSSINYWKFPTFESVVNSLAMCKL